MVLQEFINKIGFQTDQASINRVNQQFNKMKSMAVKALGAIGIGISLGQLNAIAEEFNAINDRINYAVGFSEDMKDTQKEILEAANNCKTSYSQMADAVVSLKQANEEVFPIDEATEFVEYINKLGMSAGYSQGEISSMQNSIQRATAYGTVSAQMLNRMAMQTPALIEQITKSLGVTREELDTMAKNGEVTAATIKEAILNSKNDIDHAFNQLDYSISDALLNIRNKWGYFVDDINSSTKLTQTLAQGLVAGFDGFMGVMNVIGNGIKWFIGLFDDTAQALRFVAAVAAGLFIAFNWTKIVTMAKAFFAALTSIKGILGVLKTIGIAALIVAAYLIIEDFVYFLQGNESVIGDFFDYIGVGADNAREAIFGAFGRVKEFLLGVWDTLKQGAGMFVDTIKGFFDRHGEAASNSFLRVWGLIKTYLSGVWTFISSIAKVIFGDTEDTVDGANQSMSDKVLGVWGNVLDGLSKIFDWIFEVTNTQLNNILDAVETVFGWIQSFWEAWGPTIIESFSTIWNTLVSIFGSFTAAAKGVIDFISAVFSGDWDAAWNAVKEIFTNIWDAITAFFGGIVEFFSNIFNDIVESGGVLGGIVEFFQSAYDTIVGIWEAITGFFSGIFGGISGDPNLAGVEGAISNPFSGAWETVTGLLSGAATKVAEWFSGIDLSSAASEISEFASSAWKSITDTFSDVKGWFSEKFEGAKGWLAKAVGWGSEESAAASNAESQAGAAGESAKNALIGGFNGTEAELSGVFSRITSFIGGAVSEIVSAVQSGFGNINSEIASSMGSVDADAANGWNAYSQTTGTAMSTSASLVSSGMSSVRSFVNTGMNGVRSVTMSATSAIVSYARAGMASFVGAISAGMNNAIGTARSGASGIRSAINEVSLYGSGVDLMRGLNNGIESMRGAVVGTARSIAEQVKSTINSALEVASPSKAMIRTGRFTGEGLVVGMERQKENVEAAAEKSLAGPVLEMGRNVMTMIAGMRSFAGAMAVSSPTAGAAYGSTYNRSVSQSVNINNTFNGERAFQTKAASAMNRSAEDVTELLARGLAYAR